MLPENAIEDVIRQFADPKAFLRELVQNAIDAGTAEVEITTTWLHAEQCAVITVTDWGEGMTREVIEKRLVRLFNSTKDEDRTKIGKFGIGFASVLAVNPLVVMVDTGREGEHWRLLLHPDRTYELYALETPVEGTSVAVHVPMDRSVFEAFRTDAQVKVAQWCRFAAVPITFDGDDVQQPFDLDGLIVVRFEEEGTRCVAALRPGEGLGELFNRGLALELVRSPWANVSFILDSVLLEHTLTRDRVLQNADYSKAIGKLESLIRVQLFDETKKALASWSTDPDLAWDWEVLCGLAPMVLLPAGRDAVRFPTTDGRPVTVPEARAARGKNRLLLTRGRSHVASLMPPDYVLLDIRPGSNAARLLETQLKREVPVLEDLWVHPPVVDATQTPGAEPLLTTVRRLLDAIGAAPRFLGYAHFAYPFSSIEHRGVIVSPDRDRPCHHGALSALRLKGENADVLLNPEHPIVSEAVARAEIEPEWAAYMLIKCAALAGDAVERAELDEGLDLRLVSAALARRDARRAS